MDDPILYGTKQYLADIIIRKKCFWLFKSLFGSITFILKKQTNLLHIDISFVEYFAQNLKSNGLKPSSYFTHTDLLCF